jgi:hypothetical protein
VFVNAQLPLLTWFSCCYSLLLPQAGVVPSGDAIVSIPSALVALCLNSTGLRRVREMAVLNVLVDVFTSKKTMRVLTSDTPAILGSGLEELLRCGPSSSSCVADLAALAEVAAAVDLMCCVRLAAAAYSRLT